MLNDLIDIISEIQNQVFANKRALLTLATNYASHVHIQGFPTGLPTLPSPVALAVVPTITEEFTNLPSSFVIETNLETLTQNYLELDGSLNIMSKTVRTT